MGLPVLTAFRALGQSHIDIPGLLTLAAAQLLSFRRAKLGTDTAAAKYGTQGNFPGQFASLAMKGLSIGHAKNGGSYFAGVAFLDGHTMVVP